MFKVGDVLEIKDAKETYWDLEVTGIDGANITYYVCKGYGRHNFMVNPKTHIVTINALLSANWVVKHSRPKPTEQDFLELL